jgi:hypothetical protein
VPAHILPKSKASPALLAHIVTAKYVDAPAALLAMPFLNQPSGEDIQVET